MTNNTLTDERVASLVYGSDGWGNFANCDYADIACALRELQERRKADKPPVHPTITSEQLDDETLQELIEFRRSTFEYYSKEGHKVQTIIHGVMLAALIELQERRTAMIQAGNSPVTPEGWVIVPIVPTEDMIINGFESVPDPHFSDEKVWKEYDALSGCRQAARRAELCWAAMIKAAPKDVN